MEDLITALNNLIEVINNNTVPLWITIIGTLVPIFISILVFIQSYSQNKKNTELKNLVEETNRKLQKEICDRNTKAQFHGDVLKIYNDFYFAQNIIGFGKNKVNEIFSNFYAFNGINTPTQWVTDIANAAQAINQAVNRSKLLIPASDKNLKKILEVILKKYIELQIKVNSYYNGNAIIVANESLNTVVPSQPAECTNNNYKYNYLMNDPISYNKFLKLCENEETKEINKMITELLSLFEYDKFDRYFEPYLQMNLLDDNT